MNNHRAFLFFECNFIEIPFVVTTMLNTIGRIVRITLFSLIAIILVIFTMWWIYSPGTAEPIKDSSGQIAARSISSIDTVQLGGQKQFLVIRGADSTKPVMLFVHGGPGGPEGIMMKELNPSIEKDFVMVY